MFGEYSILKDGMALILPFDKFSGKLCFPDNSEEASASADSNMGIRSFCKHMIENYTNDEFKLDVNRFSEELDNGLFFKSDIPQGFGLGSSGALVVAVFMRYIEKAGGMKDELKNLTKEQIVNLKKCLGILEGYFHGTSSGIDPLSILINQPILFKSNKEVVVVDIPDYKDDGEHVIFLLNTGVPRNTEKLVNKYKTVFAANENNEKDLADYANDGIQSFLKGDTEELYEALDKLVRFQLEEMNFLIPEAYQEIVQKGLETETYYLKICGSGGGGYMLGFSENWEKTKELLENQDLEILYRY